MPLDGKGAGNASGSERESPRAMTQALSSLRELSGSLLASQRRYCDSGGCVHSLAAVYSELIIKRFCGWFVKSISDVRLVLYSQHWSKAELLR